MKKLFVFAAALLALASCSQGDEPQAIVQTPEITFVAGQEITRAAVTKVVDENILKAEGFAVNGYMGETQIFNNVEVQHSSLGNAVVTNGTSAGDYWAPATAANVKYWAKQNNYKFAAVYPCSHSGVFSMTKEGVRSITNFENAGDIDLAVANVLSVSTGDAATKTPVLMEFSHMLSRVQFTFVNKFTGSEVVKISGVKINNVAAKGSRTETAANSWSKWTTEGTKTIEFGTMTSETTMFAKDKNDTTSYKYIIPASIKGATTTEGESTTVTCDYTIDFDVVVMDNNVEIAANQYRGLPLINKDMTFEPGQSYNFTANIKPTTVGDIYPIEFSVTVSPWGSDNNETIPGFEE